ncbi:MAG TPA: shikimate dehydrogenase [Microbacterium sp.]|nr:shikimate dehydrogenase [Microbacterium sp.]
MTPPHTAARLGVWGDPIAHSKSPALHTAAYGVLGLPWHYDRRRVDRETFDAALSGLDPAWRGLSITMPLKERAFAAAAVRDRAAEMTGAVNTLLLGGDGPRGFNTDVGGIVRAFADRGVDRVESARIVGAGSTASSAVVALSEIGAREIEVVARRPDQAAGLVRLGESLGTSVTTAPLTYAAGERPVDATIATLPSGTQLADDVADALSAHGGALLDAAYAPWPSHLGQAWQRHDRAPISGLEMLLHQALLQVRIFVAGDVDGALPDEPRVLAAMRAALMGD